MNLSPSVAEWVTIYEQESGRKPNDLSIQIAQHIEKVGELLCERGREDAQEGKQPYSAESFPALVIKAFRMDVDEDHETVQAVADLWHTDYMDGYNST